MRKRKGRRPYQILMDEHAADSSLWDLETHIAGCFAGYQNNPGFGTAVYFALEMLSGIAVQGTHLEAKGLTKNLGAPDGTLKSDAAFAVPWFCIASLAAAWESYKVKGPPLGKAFRLEGSQGRLPVIERLERTLDDHALARFVWDSVVLADSRGEKKTITVAIGEAANKFGVSDEMVRRAWRQFGSAERNRTKSLS